MVDFAPCNKPPVPQLSSDGCPIDRIVATEELKRRPARQSNFAAENQALRTIFGLLNRSPLAALQGLTDEVLRICGAGSAGVSIAEEENGQPIFRWHAVSGRLAGFVNAVMPRNFSPCGYVLQTDDSVLMKDMIRHYGYVDKLGIHLEEVLLIPFRQNDRAVGTIWVAAHDDQKKFDTEDLRLLESLAHCTSSIVKSYLMNEEANIERNKFKNLFLQTPLAIALLEGPEHRYTLANTDYRALVGERDVVGKTVREALPELEGSGIFELLDRVYSTGEVFRGREVELGLTQADGSLKTFIFNFVYQPWRDLDGLVQGIAVTAYDVSHEVNSRRLAEESAAAIRQAQEAMFLAQANTARLFDQTASIVAFMSAPDLRFEYVNPAHTRLLGFDATGKTVQETYPGTEINTFIDLLEQVYLQGKTIQVSDGQISVGGTLKHLDFIYEPRRNARGEIDGIMALVNDITDLVNARKEVESNLAILSRERDMRDRFVAALTHDLRTPLTTAKLNAQLMSRKTYGQQEVAAMSSRIVSSVDRAEAMVKDLLDASRIKAGEGIPISAAACRLDVVVEKALDGLKIANGERFEIKNDLGPIEGQWDGEALQRVVENLASNAVKYGDLDSPVCIGLTRGAGFAELSVHNVGEPIAPEEQETLFDDYRRTDSAINSGLPGWGIGLTLVKGIAEAHRGSVRVESRADYGTTFFVRLPLEGGVSS